MNSDRPTYEELQKKVEALQEENQQLANLLRMYKDGFVQSPGLEHVTQGIEEQKHAEGEFIHSNAEIEIFFNCAIDLLCIADTDGNFIRLNKEWERVLGYSTAELENRKFLNFVHPEDVEDTLRVMSQLSDQMSVVNFTNRYRCKNGEYKFIEWKSYPSGNKIYAAARDITQRIMFEEALIQKNMELESSEEEIRAANEELVATSDALRDNYIELQALKENAEESERHLRLLIDNAPEAIFIQTGLKFVYVNQVAIKLFGANKSEDMLGTLVLERFLPDDHASIRARLELFEEKFPPGLEHSLVRPDGNIRNVQISAVPFLHSGKEGSLVFVRDITERIQFEEKLQKSYDLLNNLAEHVPGVVYQYQLFPDGSSRFPYSSPGMYEIYEVTSDEVREDASPVFTRIHPDDYNYIVETIQESARNQTIYQSEFRVILPGQGVRWRHCDAKPQLMDDGSTLWHGIIIDITDKKKAEEKIKEQQLLFETMFQTISDAIVITDKHRRIILANQGITSTFGYLPDEVVGQSSEILYASVENFRQAGVEVFNEPALSSDKLYLLAYRNKFNVVFPGETFGAKLYNSKGDWIGNLGVIKNVSERIRYIDELKVAREKAEESDRLKTAFLHNISHEIRTPMNAIIGFSELLVKSDSPHNKNGYYCDVINQSCNQLLSIIDDILDLATIEACKVKIHENNIELNTTLKFIYNQFILKAVKQNLVLDLTADPAERIYITTDKTKLIEILTNLIGNALKFTLEGSISFGYTIKTRFVEFFVRDTGIGIPPEMHEEVFKRFRQLETSDARQFGGTGLGLSISKAYVELLGGKIWFNSEPGKGTEFKFTIPFHSTGKEKEVPNAEFCEIQEIEPKTLLIAEDEDSNYYLLEEFLLKTNFQLIRAVNGVQAVDICKTNKSVDLVLMDIKMPVKDGFIAASEIKAIRPTLPIIAQTAFSTDSDHEKALRSGCDDTITKPLNRDLLLSKIYKHIGRKIPDGKFYID